MEVITGMLSDSVGVASLLTLATLLIIPVFIVVFVMKSIKSGK